MKVQSLMDDARAFVESKLAGTPMTGVPDEAIRNAVEYLYEGGWHAYEADFRRFNQTKADAKVEEWSPMKLKAYVVRMTGHRLREHDEILSYKISDTEVALCLSLATVEERTRRDIVKARRIVLYTFTREAVGQPWKKDWIDVEQAAEEALVRWGVINTPERAAEQREQFETCYRPGSSKTPMLGWIARLEVSHKEAHENEVFQRPTAKGKATSK